MHILTCMKCHPVLPGTNIPALQQITALPVLTVKLKNWSYLH